MIGLFGLLSDYFPLISVLEITYTCFWIVSLKLWRIIFAVGSHLKRLEGDSFGPHIINEAFYATNA